MTKKAFDKIAAGLSEALEHVKSLPLRNPIVTHPDGKRFQRNANDQWMPI